MMRLAVATKAVTWTDDNGTLTIPAGAAVRATHPAVVANPDAFRVENRERVETMTAAPGEKRRI